MAKFLITGASGFLGTKLMHTLMRDHITVGTYNSRERNGFIHLDVRDVDRTRELIKDFQPEWIFHTAALVSVSKCEENYDEARRIIVDGTRNVVEVARKNGSRVVYPSTVYIFDGKKDCYEETDCPNPLNAYGELKLEAEDIVRSSEDSIVFRLDTLYGYNGAGEKNSILDDILSGSPIKLYRPEQERHPVWVDDVAYVSLQLIERKCYGVFNLATGELTKYNLYRSLESLVRNNSLITLVESPKGDRPKKISLNTAKLKSLGIRQHSFEESLDSIHQQLQQEYEHEKGL